eukprot:Nitzschia sp. Nitz4//scaffold136_size62208//29630//30433//NITZ4_006368-RA/size62208-augustus-gene-0.0-mRNA-1//1//CDS//3329535618//1793//frame0
MMSAARVCIIPQCLHIIIYVRDSDIHAFVVLTTRHDTLHKTFTTVLPVVGSTVSFLFFSVFVMAKAAAKKAAAAQKAASNAYQPILIGSNLLYASLLYYYRSSLASASLWTTVAILVTWILQWLAYRGILLQASSATTSTTKSTALAGGVYLDLLGYTMLLQYASVLHSPKWFYGLGLVPVLALYTLYSNFYGTAVAAGGKKK